MSSNQTLLSKADMALADLTSNGGILNPEQGDTFIRRLIKQPTIMKVCRVVTMNSFQRKINRIGFNTRILRAAPASNTTVLAAPTASGLGGRAKVTTDQITLNAKEQIATVYLPYDVLEDNIERAQAANNEVMNTGPGGLRDTLIQLIAERAATDLEEYVLTSDTTYTNGGDADDQAFLSMDDGFIATGVQRGNVLDYQSTGISKTMFKKGMQAMPSAYLRNRAAMSHYVSVNQEIEYKDTLANRGTPMGDTNVTGNGPAYAYGSPVTPVALMPDDKGLFCDPRNLIVGFWRQISMEFDKDIELRIYKIVLTLRVAVEIESAEGVTVYKNIGPVS